MADPQPAAPLLGTAFLLSQSAASSSTQHHLPVTPSLCADYASFRRALDQSRRVSDDPLSTRLNRAAALAGGAVAGRGAREMGARECDDVWRELTARWTERGEVIGYCDRALADAAAATGAKTQQRAEDAVRELSADWKERGRGLQDEREAQRSRLSTELSIESIIRARSLALFRSRCPSHPMDDPPAPALPTLRGAEEEEEERRRRRGRDERGRVRWT
ncbi:caffeine-induced death protein 2-domain-containing protein [Rhodotorula diobovata]|uniref:Caffeine-induced death protein 2-domain-containing protein n=1 Tax=Rhodotorula diobovata TaxID=5288 RepID=A0A5C5FPS4_9BASI|nr:caffeine-induced death protein 2-domain-containing protein [Rhodotorula diobovata]